MSSEKKNVHKIKISSAEKIRYRTLIKINLPNESFNIWRWFVSLFFTAENFIISNFYHLQSFTLFLFQSVSLSLSLSLSLSHSLSHTHTLTHTCIHAHTLYIYIYIYIYIYLYECEFLCVFLHLRWHQNSLHHVKTLTLMINVLCILYVLTNGIYQIFVIYCFFHGFKNTGFDK